MTLFYIASYPFKRIHAHNTRYGNKLSLVRCNTSMTQHSMYYFGVRILNLIPTEIYHSKSLNIFKKTVVQVIYKSIFVIHVYIMNHHQYS